MIEIPTEHRRTYLRNCRILAVVAAIMAAQYLKWLLVDARPLNHGLYWLLVAAEIFNITQAAGFWITASFQKWSEPQAPDPSWSSETIDLFVTVCGEPIDVVEPTIAAASRIRHPRTTVWVLDDKPNDEVRLAAERYGARYVTRSDNRGAKAGNLNHALGLARGDFFAIFDADQAAHPDFLERTLGAFRDTQVAFVQTPQVYRNRFDNAVASGAHNQQALFYGPILRGKNGMNAVFSCGTNVVYRRSAINVIGGIPEDSITEDLRSSLLLIKHGYTSVYVSEVLADGLGPLDVASYFNQQFRWGRGGLEILFKRHPYSRRMSLGQVFQYSLGFVYWFTGWAYLAYLVLPVSFLLLGFQPIQVPNNYPAHFLPYVAAALAMLIYSTDYSLRFDSLWFTLGSFAVQIRALFATFFGRTAKFVVTPKGGSVVSLRAIWPQLLTMAVLIVAAAVGLARYGPTPSVFNNLAWIIAHLVILQGFVRLTFYPWRRRSTSEVPAAARVTPEVMAERQEQ